MSNFPNNANLHTFRFPKGGISSGSIADIFDIDGDFKENEEYLREDTKALGFQTESQRCAFEVFKKVQHLEDIEQIEAVANEVIGYSNGMATFIVGNSNHSGDYTTEVVNTSEEYILIIAYVG